jgi:hypothetical protein
MDRKLIKDFQIKWLYNLSWPIFLPAQTGGFPWIGGHGPISISGHVVSLSNDMGRREPKQTTVLCMQRN